MHKQIVILYYKDDALVYQSPPRENPFHSEAVAIKNRAPKDVEWDYAVVQERYVRPQTQMTLDI